MSDVWLDLRLLARRTSYAKLLAGGLLLAASMMHFAADPWLEHKTDALRLQANALRHVPAPSDQQSMQQERYKAFLDRLPPIVDRAAVLKAIFESSASTGIVLSQAEYQLQRNDVGEYYRLRMTIPVTASYPKLRGLLDALLEQAPSASIDEISLHRETVNNLAISANLKLSIYFKDAD